MMSKSEEDLVRVCLPVPQGVKPERQIWLQPTPGSPFSSVSADPHLYPTEVFSSRPHLFFTPYSICPVLASVTTQHRASVWNLLFPSLVCSTLHQRLLLLIISGCAGVGEKQPIAGNIQLTLPGLWFKWERCTFPSST